MSGGWKYEFTLLEVRDIDLTFDWELTISSEYEADEFGQMIVSLDGDEKDISTLTGDGNGGTDDVASGTGTTQSWTNVGVGDHTVILGAYNNKKTFADEFVRVEVDNVEITATRDD